MPKVLFVSAYAPYASAPHAGGRIHYHYVRKLAQASAFNVEVIGFVGPKERGDGNWQGEPFNVEPLIYPPSKWVWFAHKVWRLWLRLAPRARYGGALSPLQARQTLEALDRRKEGGYSPDIVVLEWTQMAFLVGAVRARFPRARIVMTEHDCLFQSAQRIASRARGPWQRRLLAQRAAYIRQLELESLALADLVLVLNEKDASLLAEAGVPSDRLLVIAPYFRQLPARVPDKVGDEILFFGAMDRVENTSACRWFLKEVMPALSKQWPAAKFTILGANPPSWLRKCASRSVEVTGFVSDIAPFFERAICLVAPLVLGAGIKIKVLEGMSAGLPVLTNAIGIEGIPARRDNDYLHCETAEDYVQTILRLAQGNVSGNAIGKHGRELVLGTFDLDKSFERLRERLFGLAHDAVSA